MNIGIDTRPLVQIPAVEENFYDYIEGVFSHNRNVRREKHREWTRLFSGIRHPGCNRILLNTQIDLKNSVEIEVLIQDLMVPFREEGLPMTWSVGPMIRQDVLFAQLLDFGLISANPATCLARGLTDWPQVPVSDGLVIQKADTSRKMSDWVQVFLAICDLPEATGLFFAEPIVLMARKQPERLLLLSGVLNSEPVACGAFFIGRETGGIYNLGVIPSARKRKIASVLLTRGLEWFRESGLNLAVLQAYHSGYSLYKKLGFRSIGCIHTFFDPGHG